VRGGDTRFPRGVRLRRLGACAVLALPAAALAARASALPDRDDSRSRMDIAVARGSHNRTTDVLAHVLVAHEPFGPRDLRSREGPPGSVCINIWTSRAPGEDAPNYDVCATADRDGRAYRASVARHGRSVRRVGVADVDQTSPTRLELRFDPDRLRRPRSYRWVAQASTFGAGCPAGTGCEDFAPDRPRTARTRLGTPRPRSPSASR
jgi:hypothetical protein